MEDKPRKRISPNVILLSIVSFLNDLSSEMIMPILPMFLQSLGGGGQTIGLVSGLRDAVSNLLKIFFGYWSDKTGQRKIFVYGGYFVSSIFKLLLAMSQGVAKRRGVLGAGTGGQRPAHCAARRDHRRVHDDRAGQGVRHSPIAGDRRRGPRHVCRLRPVLVPATELPEHHPDCGHHRLCRAGPDPLCLRATGPAAEHHAEAGDRRPVPVR